MEQKIMEINYTNYRLLHDNGECCVDYINYSI